MNLSGAQKDDQDGRRTCRQQFGKKAASQPPRWHQVAPAACFLQQLSPRSASATTSSAAPRTADPSPVRPNPHPWWLQASPRTLQVRTSAWNSSWRAVPSRDPGDPEVGRRRTGQAPWSWVLTSHCRGRAAGPRIQRGCREGPEALCVTLPLQVPKERLVNHNGYIRGTLSESAFLRPRTIEPTALGPPRTGAAGCWLRAFSKHPALGITSASDGASSSANSGATGVSATSMPPGRQFCQARRPAAELPAGSG